jgi:nucleoside phosphorylase
MSEDYDLRKIRALLTEGFTDTELRRLCYDVPDFRPVYDELAGHTGKANIIDHLIEYADQKLLLDTLLELAKEINPARYEKHQPYYNPSGDLTPSIQPSIPYQSQKILTSPAATLHPAPVVPLIPPVDFVIITALEEERDAVLAKLPNHQKLPPTRDDVHVYYSAHLPVTFTDGSTGVYRLVVMPLLGMGRVKATAATGDAIRRWQPRYVILVGIAGGVAAKGIKLGDILVSDQVVDYELQKVISENDVDIRWEVHRADSRLIAAARNLTMNDWQKFIQTKRPRPGAPRRHVGPIASGDKVIAFGEVLEKYRNHWPALIGVEMEAVGVAAASFQAANPPGFFMVRGVSDLANQQKGSRQVEKWRPYACDIAAAYTIALLQSGPVLLSPHTPSSLPDESKPSSNDDWTISSTTSSTAPFRQIKIKTLKKHLEDLIADYEAANNQLNNSLSEVERNRLRRQIEKLEQDINQTQNELDSLGSIEHVSKRRRVDAAIPSHAAVGQHIDLLVQVRFPDSPPLSIEDWPTKHQPASIEQVSGSAILDFPQDPRTGKLSSARLEIRVVAPDLKIEGKNHQIVEVPPDQESRVVTFFLTAQRAGNCRINVEIYNINHVYLGTIPTEIIIGGEIDTASTMKVANLLLIIVVERESLALSMPHEPEFAEEKEHKISSRPRNTPWKPHRLKPQPLFFSNSEIGRLLPYSLFDHPYAEDDLNFLFGETGGFWSGHPLYDQPANPTIPQVIYGPDGCGKTALARALVELENPSVTLVNILPSFISGRPEIPDIQRQIARSLLDFICASPFVLAGLGDYQQATIARQLCTSLEHNLLRGSIERAKQFSLDVESHQETERWSAEDARQLSRFEIFLEQHKTMADVNVAEWLRLTQQAISSLGFHFVLVSLDPNPGKITYARRLLSLLRLWADHKLVIKLFLPQNIAEKLKPNAGDLDFLPLTWTEAQIKDLAHWRFETVTRLSGARLIHRLEDIFDDNIYVQFISHTQNNPRRLAMLWRTLLADHLNYSPDCNTFSQENLDRAVEKLK